MDNILGVFEYEAGQAADFRKLSSQMNQITEEHGTFYASSVWHDWDRGLLFTKKAVIEETAQSLFLKWLQNR